jgi:hypothetical protein
VVVPELPFEPPPHPAIPKLRNATESTMHVSHKCRTRFRDRSKRMSGSVNRPNPPNSNLEAFTTIAAVVVSVATLTVNVPEPPEVSVRLEGDTEQVAY